VPYPRCGHRCQPCLEVHLNIGVIAVESTNYEMKSAKRHKQVNYKKRKHVEDVQCDKVNIEMHSKVRKKIPIHFVPSLRTFLRMAIF
jgi:hypothetical protein